VDPGASEPDEGFGSEVVGLEASGEDGEEAGLLVFGEELGLGQARRAARVRRWSERALFVAGAQFAGIVVGAVRVHGGEVGEHEVKALPGGGVAVAFDHLPVEGAGLVGAADLAEGHPAW
jgi:hypothetical protein